MEKPPRTLEELLTDIQIEAQTLPNSPEKEGVITLIKGIKTYLTSPENMAEYLRRSPITSQTLQALAREHPEEYASIVPQAVDSLTKLHAHQYFLRNLLPDRLKEAYMKNAPISLVVFDIDNFKSVNDSYGHPTGTYVIETLAGKLKESFRWHEDRRKTTQKQTSENRLKASDRRNYKDSGDLIARLHRYEHSTGRIGGDEFAIVLYGCSESDVEKIMNRFLERIRSEKFTYEGKNIPITLSIGIASAKDLLSGNLKNLTAHELDKRIHEISGDLYDRADKAQYEAKRLGKDGVVVYRPEIPTNLSS